MAKDVGTLSFGFASHFLQLFEVLPSAIIAGEKKKSWNTAGSGNKYLRIDILQNLGTEVGEEQRSTYAWENCWRQVALTLNRIMLL